MTKVKVELECLKDLLKREPIVKVVNELPNKETADLNYIYVVPKEGEGKDTKAYVLRPDRSGYDAIDLTPQLVNVVGEGYITVEKETRNENGDVTFTVSTSPSLKALLESLTAKDNELEAKVTSLEAKDSEQDAKLDALKAHGEQVDDALEAVGQNIEKTVDLIDNKVQALNKVNESQNKDIAELQKDSQGLKELTSELDNSVNELNDQLKTLDGKIDEEVKAVHTEIEDVTNAVHSLETNDASQDEKIKALENRTDNFINNVAVSKADGKVKLTYTRVDGSSSEVEFEDSDTVTLAYDDEPLKTRIKALEDKEDKDTIYNDTELKNRVKALEDKPEPPHEANLFYAKGDIIGIGTETDIRITRDELVNADTIKVGDTVVDHYWDNKVFNTGMFKVVSIDGDNIVLNGVNNINYKHPKQELTLKGNELSISDGNSVTLPSGTVYDDTELKGRVTTLEGKTDNFVSNVSVSREGNTVKLTYTMVNGDTKEVEFTDNDTVSLAYDDSALKSRIEALEKKPDKDTVYNDTELKEQVNDLGSSVASALHDISEIRVNNESRLSALEGKEDKDKQTLSLEGNTLSISNGNSVELPTPPKVKPTKVTTNSEGVTVTHTETEDANTYNVNIDGALEKYYDKSKTYTKEEVDNIVAKQEDKATDITVFRGTFPNKEKVMEGSVDKDISPRATLTYSSSTGVGIARIDFKIMSAVSQNTIIVQLPDDAPTPAELIEAQAWVGNVATSIWIGKGERVVRMVHTDNPEIFGKRIIINIPGIFKKKG